MCLREQLRPLQVGEQQKDEPIYEFGPHLKLTLRFHPEDQSYVDILMIEADPMGRGWGTYLMHNLIAIADRCKTELHLYCRGPEDEPTDTNRLARWYERLGFKRCEPDYTPDTSDPDHIGIDMWRPLP